MKLLIVDDSMIMRHLITKYLKESSIEVVGTANDGEEALKMFEESAPELVTMDITMPKMDGLTCLEKMLAIKPDTKIVVITAVMNEETRREAMAKGAADFLTKPFNEEVLKETLSKLV